MMFRTRTVFNFVTSALASANGSGTHLSTFQSPDLGQKSIGEDSLVRELSTAPKLSALTGAACAVANQHSWQKDDGIPYLASELLQRPSNGIKLVFSHMLARTNHWIISFDSDVCWRSLSEYRNQSVLAMAFLTGLLVVGLWIFSTRFFLKSTSRARSQRFRIFAQSNDCQPASPLPKPFLAGLRHKAELLSYQGNDLLDGLFASKYRHYGLTHALLDQHDIPIVVHTIDPANLNAVLNACSNDWRPSKSRTNTLKPLAQDGLLLTEGEVWHQKRKLIQRHIGTRRAKDVQRDESHMQTLFKAIGNADSDGWTGEVDLLDLFHRLALDMSTSYLLGRGSEAQKNGIFEAEKEAMMQKYNLVPDRKKHEMTYEEAYEIVRAHLSWRSKLGSLYWLADGPTYRRACAILNQYADDLIAQAITARTNTHGNESAGDFGLIDNLVKELGDPIEIRNLIMDLFIAGQNMTGTMAAWIFAQLEQHPQIYQRVRNEVLDSFGTEDSGIRVTWDRMKECRTMQHVILETLRMYPLLANIGRTAKCDTILPRGGGPDGASPIAVPAGAAVTCNVYLMHRREEEWGPDAHTFNPDRWIDRKFGPEYAPFGAGPRVCVGQQLAKTELSFLITRMMQRFAEIKAPEGQDNLVKGYRVVIAPANGVKVRLRRSA